MTIQVEAVGFPTHSTLEVVGLTAASGVDVQTLLWGPLPTTLDDTIGETVGVVANSDFVVGVRPLNDKTVGGWPNEHLAYGFGPDLVWNPYGLQTGVKDEWLASNVAAKTTWGSVLRATTYDYSKVRVRQRTNGYEIPLGPLPAPEGRIVGSKIALFGSAPDLALTVLSQIAKEHDQAYPTLDGQWQKAAQRTSQTHFWVHDLDTGTVTAAAKLAAQAGVRNIYAISGNGPWVSHGHYQFNGSFGGSDAAAAQVVAAAAKEGIEVGVHTLSTFIDANDPYVKAASRSTARGGRLRPAHPPAGRVGHHVVRGCQRPAGLRNRRSTAAHRRRVHHLRFRHQGQQHRVAGQRPEPGTVVLGCRGPPGRYHRRPAHPERLRRRAGRSADHRRDRDPAGHRLQHQRRPRHVLRRA